MTKKCKDKDYKSPKKAEYFCKNCNREAKKDKKLCKPQKKQTTIMLIIIGLHLFCTRG
jgi:hypothetical protein